MAFWQENVDSILKFNYKRVLNNSGKISKAVMEQKVRKTYLEYDIRRKAYDAKLADKQDFEEIETLINKHKR